MVLPQNSENAPSSKLSNKVSELRPSHPQIQFHFLTLFPEIFPPILNASLLGKAQNKGLVSYHLTQIRDFSEDKHRTVDDTPYGGGEGMLLKADVLYSAWKSTQFDSQKMDSQNAEPQKLDLNQADPQKTALNQANSQKTVTILLSPQGAVLNQEMAKDLATYSKIILICGHYEGVDERFIDLCVDREISIGDYVMTGGEVPAMVLADTVTRLIPGVVQNQRSVSQDSLENGLLKYPQYTRPRDFMGISVPEILLSGDHQAIEAWREAQMRERTLKKRPDLWEKMPQNQQESLNSKKKP